jgi:hypothetical protein
VISDQGLTEEHKDEAVTSRNLTLRDLCVQTKHYNANIRKGKMTELRHTRGSMGSLIIVQMLYWV